MSPVPVPHHDPPATPAGVLLYHPAIIGSMVALSLALAVAAAVDGGAALRTWDVPIQHWVEGHRSDTLDTLFRVISRLGSNLLVFAVLGPLLLVLGRRCRTMAFTLAISVLARSPIEFLIKELVDRPRPNFDRLVDGTGPSHPSGHVLAAIALWGLLPPMVAALTHRHFWWWASTVVGIVVVVLVAACRVYLGVHWFSDVVQGLLLGSLYLVGVEAVFEWHHRRRACPLFAHLYANPDPSTNK